MAGEGGGGNPITTVFQSTTQQLFGNGAWRFSGDNHGLSIDYNSRLDDFNNNNFVIEMRVKLVFLNKYQALYSRYSNDPSNYTRLILNPTNNLEYYYVAGGTTYCSAATTNSPINDQSYYHIAVVRSGNNCLIYINGISQNLTINTPFTTSLPALPYQTLIGVDFNLTNASLNGYIDEFLITNGTDKGWNVPFIELPLGQYFIP